MNNLVNMLINDPSPYVRHALATSPKLSSESILTLMKDDNWFVRSGLAGNPNLTESTLSILSNDPCINVRIRVAGNSSTTSTILTKMIAHVFEKREENLKNGIIEDTEVNVLSAIAINTNVLYKDLIILAKDTNQYVRRAVASIS
jgi:hypothetical protein